ncbi:MAG TPA: Qat anti-phage system QueC-like protein QatC [Oscillatoriaceae cyanobacterium]
MSNIVCAPMAQLPPAGRVGGLRFELYGPGQPGIGTAGKSLVRDVVESGLAPNARAWDFLSIALSVLCADEGVLRGLSPDGWTREIDLSIAVADPAFWTGQGEALESLLAFLTGDRWSLRFTAGGAFPPALDGDREERPEDCVCLLSGGVDSLAGAVTLAHNGHRPFVVSQIARGDKEHQADFAAGIGGGLRGLQTNHQIKSPGTREISQRGRSIIFIAYGLLAATSLDSHRAGERVTLFIPENGFISINAPLTPLRLGSLSTRTTHPVYLQRLQSLLDAAALRVDLVNPFRYMTKGEVLLNCPDPATLTRFVFDSTSCGRFARKYRHCGRCVPCLVRRAAFLKWGHADVTTKGYIYDNISINDHDHHFFEDVRSVGMAIEAVKQHGLTDWLGATLNAAELGDVADYEALVGRGLEELEVFMRRANAL